MPLRQFSKKYRRVGKKADNPTAVFDCCHVTRRDTYTIGYAGGSRIQIFEGATIYMKGRERYPFNKNL
jgi:hypothetical protein